MRFWLAAVVFSFLLASCKKDQQVVQPLVVGKLTDTSGAPPQVVVNFQATANNENLVAGKRYVNPNEEEFTVTKFNYYFSNVRLYRPDGSYFEEKESYHLIKHLEGKTSFTLQGVPAGEYSRIAFMIGVDSLRNVSGAQTGDLDEAQQMFWNWNSGYIFYKLEGSFTSQMVPDGGEYSLHIGGFQYPYSCIQTNTLTLPNSLIAKKKTVNSINLKVAVEQVFETPKRIGFDDYYALLPNGPGVFRELSLNYRDMFTVWSVTNPN